MPRHTPATPESCRLQGLGLFPCKRSLLVPPKETPRQNGWCSHTGPTLEVESPSDALLTHLGSGNAPHLYIEPRTLNWGEDTSWVGTSLGCPERLVHLTVLAWCSVPGTDGPNTYYISRQAQVLRKVTKPSPALARRVTYAAEMASILSSGFSRT